MSDEDLITKQHDQRLINHPHSMKSKAPLALPRPTPGTEVGDLVYIHSDRNKSRVRDRYLVTNVEGAFFNVRKFIGSQLRSTSYRIKKSECYHVPGDIAATHSPQRPDDSSGDEEDPIPQTTPPAPPEIPCAISLPADQHVPEPEDTDTFPWDQVLESLWTSPQTTPQRGSFFPLGASTSRDVQRASVGTPHVTMIMLQNPESDWS